MFQIAPGTKRDVKQIGEKPPKRICLVIPTISDRKDSMMECVKMASHLTRDQETKLSLLIVQNGVAVPTLHESAIQPDASNQIEISVIAEPRLGIPFARNAALRFVRENGYDYIAFIDDDAEPDPNWLLETLKALKQYDAVSGPQIPRFPEGAERKLCEASVYKERRISNGKLIPWAATNNVLFSVPFVARHDLWFDEDMRTGGSDKEFFLRFSSCGGQIVWAAHALVFEDVSPSRLSLAWVWQREWRKGATEFYIMRSTNSLPKAVALCLVKSAYYSASALKNIMRFSVGKAEGWTDAIADTAHGVSVVLGIWPKFRPKAYS